jgi:hypothetical protein
MPLNDCIRLPPARSAPNRIAASSVPHGRFRPSSATSRPSKPMLPATAGVRACAVPSTCVAPPRPARPPATTMSSVYVFATLMPAVFAAAGLAPTARSSKPNADRLSNQAIAAVTRTASTMPRLTRRAPPSEASWAEVSTDRLIASDRSGLCTPFCRISQVRNSPAV